MLKTPLLLFSLLSLTIAACGNPDHSSPFGAREDGGLGGAGGAPCDPPPPECISDADCQGMLPDYKGCNGKWVCEAGTCTPKFPEDINPTQDTKGNCMKLVCDDGDVIVTYDENDPENDADPCSLDVCSSLWQTVHYVEPSMDGATCVTWKGEAGTCQYEWRTWLTGSSESGAGQILSKG
jgi:hypothetical protein